MNILNLHQVPKYFEMESPRTFAKYLVQMCVRCYYWCFGSTYKPKPNHNPKPKLTITKYILFLRLGLREPANKVKP